MIPNSEIIPDKNFFLVKSKAGLTTSMLSLRTFQTSFGFRLSIFNLFVNFRLTPQAYLGTWNSFADLQSIDVPILFATPRFEKASAPNKNRSHFIIAFSAAKSGKTITLIPAFAKSLAVCLPCNNGSTSVV